MAMANPTRAALKCEVCLAAATIYNKFCSTCGTELDEETLAMKYYFNEGYDYEVILCFLLKYHSIEMSLRTLKDRFKSLGLRRRNLLDSNDQDVRTRIQREFDGRGCLSGYRSMWQTLRRDGYQVSRQQWRPADKKWIPRDAKEGECGSSREEFTLIQGRTIVDISMGTIKLNLTVSPSMAVLTVTAAK